MKKWHSVLWIVFISMAFGTVGFLFFSPQNVNFMRVARVNGRSIHLKEYYRSLAQLQERINTLKPYAKMYGLSEDMFIKSVLGVSNPAEFALNSAVKDQLLDSIAEDLAVRVDGEWFKQELVKSLPELVDQDSKFDVDAYERYLQRMSITPAAFEKEKEREFSRNLVQQLVYNMAYVPNNVVNDFLQADYGKKSFEIMVCPQSFFDKKAEEEKVSDQDLEAYFSKHTDKYRVPEKRSGRYWVLSIDEFKKQIEIDDLAVNRFYERNKSSLFRVAPQIQLRRILLALPEGHTSKQRDDLSYKAKNLQKLLIESPERFAELAKKHSDDKKTAANGGLTEYFSRNTYSQAMEALAFKLRDNEVSELIRTPEGFEIVQLVGRKKAYEKQLNDVREEIVDTLRAKKALASVKADLERLVHTYKQEPTALDEFIQKHGLKENKTSLLSQEDTQKTELEGSLAAKLFAGNKAIDAIGHFAHEEKFVLYQISDIQKSYVPKQSILQDQIKSDYLKSRSRDKMKSFAQDWKKALLNNQITLEDLAKKEGFAHVVTDKIIKNTTKVKGLENFGTLIQKMFVMSDPSQVVQHRHENTLYFGRLKEADDQLNKRAERDRSKLIEQEKYKTRTTLLGAFIASLQRNAKIEIDNKVLEAPYGRQATT
ncbi:MAG: peptidylprolyl isomerase [Epsilonproteobacteria bacterium]|nr:peptidylprolyl isomerase [Campylobacterota bacterium]